MTNIAIAVVELDGRFLIGQRPPGVALAGLWEFPGGKVEPGETAESAAVRECQEETGLVVEVVGQYPTIEHTYAHGGVLLHFFQCRPVDRRVLPAAHFQWIGRSELKDYAFPAANEAILRTLQTST